MPNRKASCPPALVARLFRPAIVEAKLITAKRAQDLVYVATLAEELNAIEGKISAMEHSLQIDAPQTDSRPRPCRVPDRGADADWIREKSCELDLRLRRIETPGNTAKTGR